MTADNARSNVKAWKNNQAQIANLEIERDDKLNRLFFHFFEQINSLSEGGFTQFKFRETKIKEKYGKFNVDKVRELFHKLGFSVNRDWDSYNSDWCWFIGW